MEFFAGWLLFLSVATAVYPLFSAAATNETMSFNAYVVKFNRSYGSDEYERRRRIFQENVARQEWLNKQRDSAESAVYGINAFTDLLEAEFRERYMIRAERKDARGTLAAALPCKAEIVPSPPGHWDWRERNAVTPVENQKQCGSCWAFAAVETVESQWAIRHQHLYKLSVQQVLDCTPDSSCSGGSSTNAFDWMIKNPGSPGPEKELPYTAKSKNTCPGLRRMPVIVTNFSNCQFQPEQEFTTLKTILYQHGPVAVVINAIGLKDYVSGIVQHHCGPVASEYHSVVIVGYDTRGDIPYWIVRNSWGSDFGEQGYFRLVMGRNICGVGDTVSYPYVS